MKTKTKVRVYTGQLSMRLGIRRWARKGYTVVGNVQRTKRLFGDDRYTVTYQKVS